MEGLADSEQCDCHVGSVPDLWCGPDWPGHRRRLDQAGNCRTGAGLPHRRRAELARARYAAAGLVLVIATHGATSVDRVTVKVGTVPNWTATTVVGRQDDRARGGGPVAAFDLNAHRQA